METTSVELTPALKERIRKNRERALQIQAERKRQKVLEEEKHTQLQQEDTKGKKIVREEEEVECEEWEISLSDWVSKKEAVAKYCLPEGTLAVCEVTTKENPHHKGWAPMKLYKRSELRERAYKRFGGKEGLMEERMKREQKRLCKDLKMADTIFKS